MRTRWSTAVVYPLHAAWVRALVATGAGAVGLGVLLLIVRLPRSRS
jgi:hypothetical protein